jgi:hypothetical protein
MWAFHFARLGAPKSSSWSLKWVMQSFQGVNPYKVVLEHVAIVALVITITHHVGKRIGSFCH